MQIGEPVKGQVIARELSRRHLRDFMCPTMDQTTMLLQFIMPILKGTYNASL